MIRRTALVFACVVLMAAVSADAFDLNLAVGADFGGELPVPTQIVVGLSDMVKSKILYIIIAVVLGIVAFKKFYNTEKGRDTVD